MNGTKKSPEQRVRIKIGLILIVVILYFCGLFIYSYSLKKNMDIQKMEMDNSYKVLSTSNQLIISIQQAQDVLNLYLASPRKVLQQQYDSIAYNISLQILNIKSMNPKMEQDILLQDIDSLLLEKNKIVRRLTGLFRSQNPLDELDKKINRYDEIIQESVVVTTNTDTTRVEKQRKGFWNRLRNLFDPASVSDSTIRISRTEQEEMLTSRVDTTMYSDLKNITEEASKSYSSRIEGIEREVRELLFAEQNISLHISELTNEFYNETIRISWQGTENSGELTQRAFRFAILVGSLSVFFILIIIFLITDDLNKGQKARSDLVREQQLTEELIESRHKLLLSVSHDVKTPLSSMMGYMEMWHSEESNEDKKRQLESALSSGKHILNMLTNLLEFSHLQQKSVQVHNSQFNLIKLTEDIIGMFQPFTEEKALSLTFENLAVSPFYINTDETLLKQILTNLISNAVKYTIQGGITIQLKYDDQLIFTIIDSGIGMDIDELPEIFKPFSRMQSPLKVEGSGFGMYVTKGLVDLLKGKLKVTSEKGIGTSVVIRLPLRKVEEKLSSSESVSRSRESGNNCSVEKDNQFHKVLLFEDDLPLGNMIKEYLLRNGYKVNLCSNLRDLNSSLRTISQFDIVFTDMQMTAVSGLDILREIRKRERRIPVWLMTAHDEYTTERALSEGFSGLVKKPIAMSILLDILLEEKRNNLQKEFPQLFDLFPGDEHSIKDILASFIESSQKEMDLLAIYVEEGDFEKAQQLSHKIYPFFSQLDADHLCIALRKMDKLREENDSSYPNWQEELTKTIIDIRHFSVHIREDYL